MYGKNVKVFCWFCFMLVILFTTSLFTGCRTTMVPDFTDRDYKYRELEAEIRDGQTELVVTGSELESTSGQIKDSVNNIESTGKQLKQSIEQSTGSEQEIGEILQRITERKIPDNVTAELRNKFPELFIE